MKNGAPEVDAYIEKAAPFAQPILKRIRAAVHKADATITESLKWGHIAFDHDGRILVGVAAFKQHVAWGFWSDKDRDRVTDVSELPPENELIEATRRAIAEKQAKAAAPKTPRPKKAAPPVEVPDDLAAALKKNAAAAKTFEKFPPSHRREYVAWITEAKREETRAKRVAQTIEWLAEGKSRNWKYERSSS